MKKNKKIIIIIIALIMIIIPIITLGISATDYIIELTGTPHDISITVQNGDYIYINVYDYAEILEPNSTYFYYMGNQDMGDYTVEKYQCINTQNTTKYIYIKFPFQSNSNTLTVNMQYVETTTEEETTTAPETTTPSETTSPVTTNDDIVILPSSGVFSIYETAGNYFTIVTEVGYELLYNEIYYNLASLNDLGANGLEYIFLCNESGEIINKDQIQYINSETGEIIRIYNIYCYNEATFAEIYPQFYNTETGVFDYIGAFQHVYGLMSQSIEYIQINYQRGYNDGYNYGKTKVTTTMTDGISMYGGIRSIILSPIELMNRITNFEIDFGSGFHINLYNTSRFVLTISAIIFIYFKFKK